MGDGWIIYPQENPDKTEYVHEKDALLPDISYERFMEDFKNENVPRNMFEFKKFFRIRMRQQMEFAKDNFEYCAEEMLRKMFPEQYREEKRYNGKRVYTLADSSLLKIGDYVDDKWVEDVRDALPPAYCTSEIVQLGEPYTSALNLETGEYESIYATYRKITDGIWEYCGHHFKGKTE